MRGKHYLFILVIFCALPACQRKEPRELPVEDTSSPYLNTRSGVTYVGKEACKDCHIPQYDTYMQTAMGQSFRVGTLTNSHANFRNPKPVYDSNEDLYYQPFHRGEDLFVMEYRLSGKDTVHKRIEQINYIVGSGHHTNSHITEVNGYLYQVPVTFYTQDGVWDLAPGFQEGNTRFNRVIALECMTCHNARPDFVPGSENRFSRVPHGIDCEQCHGPGSLHVEWMNTGRLVDTTKTPDYSVINPRRLSPERQYNLCQRCHMQGAAILKEGKTFLDFRPGTDLTDVTNVFWPRYADSVQHFIMASHPDRLQMSPCYQATWSDDSRFEPLTCVTCHNPHLEPEEVVQNNYCQNCHRPEQDLFCTAPEPVRAAENNDCVACHMPLSGSIDIPHIRITDHYIRVAGRDSQTSVQEVGKRLSPADVAEQQEFFGLRSLIEESPTPQDWADGYLTFYEQFISQPKYLDSAVVFLELAQNEVALQKLIPSLIRLWFLQSNHTTVTELVNKHDIENIADPWTLYRSGEAFFQGRDYKQAIHFFNLAVNQAPDHLRFMSKLGQAYAADNQLDQAITIFDRVIQANPKFSIAYNNRGFARVVQGNLDLAEQDFKAALALDPDAIQPLANLASLYYNTGRSDLARPYAARLVQIEPGNTNYRQLLSAIVSASTE